MEYRAHYYSLQEQMREIMESGNADNRGGGESPYVIPCVVHVIHLGEAVGVGSNISDEQIQGALDGLNDRYANLVGNGLDIEMTFCLAKRDPDGCSTNGILRVNGIGLPGYQAGGVTRGGKTECSDAAEDEDVKDLSHWPVEDYYNIWVVHTICGGWAGYAYYPWGSIYDGAIMHRSYMTYSSTTLSHEIGHAFNLPHTFSGDNDGEDCPLNSNCLSQGDNVCDTPPHKISDCGSTNPCTTEGIWDNSRRNYMSYCGGTNRFTQGQKERMHASLQVPPRMHLLNSDACEPSDFGTTAAKTNVSCFGFCDGSISVTPACEGDYSYLWSNGETESSINELCPGEYTVVVEDAITGLSHTASFEVIEGSSIDPNAMITTNDALSFCEGESAILVASISGTYSWSNGEDTQSIEVTESGSYSLIVNTPLGCEYTSTAIDVVVHPTPLVTLTLPAVINTMTTPFVLNTGTPAGGEYWGAGVSEGSFYPALAGVGTHVVNYTYADENGCENVAQQTIIVEQFVGVNDIIIEDELRIYPNPNTGTFYIEMNAHENAALSCYDALGQLVFERSISSKRDSDKIEIQMTYESEGVYYLKLSFADKLLVQRFLMIRK